MHVGWISAAILLLGAMAPAGAAWDPDAELQQIRQEIRQSGADWVADHTSVSDLTPEQKAAMLGARFDPESWKEMSIGTVVAANPRDIPASWDWRAMNGMTGVRNQGGCGSCWSFGATGAFESMIRIYRGETFDLSEQQGLVCSEGGGSCAGGFSTSVANLQATMGQVTESCMPYTGNDGSACIDYSCDSVDRIRGYLNVPNDEASLKTAIMTGPLAVNLFAPNSLFYYSGGCFSYSGIDPINHCVVLCGWNDAACSGQGAWLIKNSWGGGWGEGGYGWIRMGDCRVGDGAILLDYVPTPVRLAFDAVEILDGANGFLDAGETTQLRITLKNFGRLTATGVSAFLSTTTTGVTVVDNQAGFPDIPAGATGVSAGPNFTVQIAPGTTGVIAFDLTIHSSQMQNQPSSFPVLLGPSEVFYSSGFETGNEGWTHGGTADDWRRAIPGTRAGKIDPRAAARGSYCFGNDLSESGSAWNNLYAPSEDSWLQSPAIDCSGKSHVYLAFRRWLTVQRRPSDYTRLYVNGTEIFVNPILVPTVDDAWQEVLYDISALADGNPNVTLRFTLKSSGNIEYGGWTIDDVRLIVPTGNPAGVSDLPAPGARLEVATYPNPFNPMVNFRVILPESGRPVVRIHDAAGRLVRTIDMGLQPAGTGMTSWNGSDERGHALPGGIYYVTVAVGGREVQSRVVMLK
jgi:C1A family cysteine protease